MNIIKDIYEDMGGKEETMKQADLDAKIEAYCGDRYDVQEIKEIVFIVKI